MTDEKSPLALRIRGFLERWDVSLDCRLHLWVDRLEPDDYVERIDARILLRASDESPDADPIDAGSIKAYRAQLGTAGNDGRFDSVSVLDAHGPAADYLELFDGITDGWSKRVQEQFEIFGCDLLMIDHVEIKPEYRGSGLGLVALRRFMDSFEEGCALVALFPHPPGARKEDTAWFDARRKLERHWALLGFEPVTGTDIWAMPTATVTPTIEDLMSQHPGHRHRERSLSHPASREAN